MDRKIAMTSVLIETQIEFKFKTIKNGKNSQILENLLKSLQFSPIF